MLSSYNVARYEKNRVFIRITWNSIGQNEDSGHSGHSGQYHQVWEENIGGQTGGISIELHSVYGITWRLEFRPEHLPETRSRVWSLVV